MDLEDGLRSFAMPTDRIFAVELIGGPFDGLVVAVAHGMDYIHLRDGARLQRYDADEQHMGYAVRTVYRWTQEVV